MLLLLWRHRQRQQAGIGTRRRKTDFDTSLRQGGAQAVAHSVVIQPLRLITGTGRIPGQTALDQADYSGFAQNGVFLTA